MKNIHIIPTDKPSRLCKDEFGKFYVTELMESKISFFKNQHIYITSNEEIKDVRPHKGKWQLEQGQILNKFPNYLTDLSECKLVIMTTNQDLIKDGVQAIDDEFLEWFVAKANDSGKPIDIVEVLWIIPAYKTDKEYKIIIPKEEPKQEKSYTEEDLHNAYMQGHYLCLNGIETIDTAEECFIEWFEQLKNK